MLASSLATPYVMDPLLETVGLMGCHTCVFGKTIEPGGHCTGGIQSFVLRVTKSSLYFDVPKSLCQFVFEFFGGALENRLISVGVC